MSLIELITFISEMSTNVDTSQGVVQPNPVQSQLETLLFKVKNTFYGIYYIFSYINFYICCY